MRTSQGMDGTPLWCVTVYPFESDPYSTTYLFTSLPAAQAFADKINDLPEEDRIFLCGGRGRTVHVWHTTTTTPEAAYRDLGEHYAITSDEED